MPALPGMLPSKLGLAQAFAAQLGAGTTAVVLMENLLPVCALRDDKEYKEVGTNTPLFEGIYLFRGSGLAQTHK